MEKQIKHKTSLRRKIAFLIVFSCLIVMLTGFGLGYLWGFNLLRTTIGESHVSMADLISESVSRILNEEVSDLHIYMSLPLRRGMIEKQNLKYRGMNEEAVSRYFKDMDEKWKGTQKDNPLIEELLATETSNRLKSLVAGDAGIAEIFMTDVQGGLVASSNKTSDFYQADEIWWQKAFNNGKGADFIGDAELDTSSNVISISLAVPIRGDSGEVIGACKAVMDVNRLFEPLKDFVIGKTGHAVLINKKGVIIFQEDITPLSQSLTSEENLQKILETPKGWIITSKPNEHNKKTFIAFTASNYSLFLREGILWKVCVGQNADEVFAPLNTLMFQLFIVVILAAAILVLASAVFSAAFIKPLIELRNATEKIAKGDLDYHIEVKTGDEIEEFADFFNRMTDELKKSTRSVSALNKEITERKKVEYALKESEERYRVLYDSSRDAIMTLMPGGKFLSGNPATLEMFGCKDEKEFISKTPADLSPEYQPDGELSSVRAKQMMDMAMEKGSHFFEWTHKNVGGKNFFATVLLTRMKMGNKEFLQATVRDISVSKNIETKVRQAAEEWQRTFDSIADLVFIQDTNFVILKANRAFAEAIKMKPEDIIGKKCYDLLHGRDKPWPNCPFEKTKHDSKAHTEEVDDPNIGLPLSVSTSPIFDKKGKLVGSVHIAQDIRARKKAEKVFQDTKDELEKQTWGLRKSNEAIKSLYKELEGSNKELQKLDQLKSDFVSTVSHELRTPLSITKEGISLVLDRVTGDISGKQEKILSTARDNIDRLARIINDLLDISKIEAGKVDLKKALVDLSGKIKDDCTLWKIDADKKNQTLQISVPDSPVSIYVDPDKMDQILLNLVSNAVKYTPDKGKIKVELKDKEGEVEVSISDTGVGIAKEDFHKLFGKFQQFSRAIGPGAKGTGLGLAIVKQLVEMHKGNIRVESELHKGSKFIFSIPKLDVEEVFREYISSGIKQAADRKTHLSLLIVHVVNFKQIFEELGYDKAHALLKDIAKETKGSLRRRADSVVRDTGDLIVLLFDTRKEDVAVVRKRVEKTISDYLSGGKEKFLKNISITFGNATYPDEAITDEELLKKARPA
ncbi:MAG: PAS domain S-box protein [Candidatus Omnitrophica bacterium]|nr:PAS domain S-box protein [Candidatus Omnitrophota bacterium]